MGTGNRMFAEVRKNDLGHSIEGLGSKPSLKSKILTSSCQRQDRFKVPKWHLSVNKGKTRSFNRWVANNIDRLPRDFSLSFNLRRSRCFADIKNFYIGDSIELLGPKPSLKSQIVISSCLKQARFQGKKFIP